jgi:hypothetical protein
MYTCDVTKHGVGLPRSRLPIRKYTAVETLYADSREGVPYDVEYLLLIYGLIANVIVVELLTLGLRV